MIEKKVVRNGILNNLYSHEKLPILQSSPSRSRQKCSDSKKILRLDKSDRQKYFRFDDKSVLITAKVARKGILSNLYLKEKFLFCTVFHPGASKVDQTHKFNDFLNLTQFFSMTPYSGLVGVNDVNNVIYNNLH